MKNDELVIDVKGLTKRFGDKTVVNGISLKVRKGEICGFLGPNGSGKTTTIRMICGLLQPDAGEGVCLGKNVLTESNEVKRNVGYMTQRFSMYEDLTIRENLDFIARIYEVEKRKEKVEKSFLRLGLTDRSDQLAGQLSGGWKQRLALASCLLHEPKLLLLDEPTAGVDPKARREFWDEIHLLAEEGITTLVSTHYMDEAERCNRLAYIAYGNILVEGTGEDIVQASGISSWRIRGENLGGLVAELKQLPGVNQVAAFGNTLHVSGKNRGLIGESILSIQHRGYQCEEIKPGLEDVFISLMATVKEKIK
ncbi:MAG: ABC transporter ATP-binding protein [Nitrospinae bacterium]|nr:ABC transporter ATP-binding protein [Nitrospinota bacterium]